MQDDVIEFLSAPSTHGGLPVERVETHASVVFLAGARAFKLKRAVRYDYLDFSTVDRRRAMCEAELRINRRTAPSIYVRTVAVTREGDGSLALGGAGEPADWLLEMVRFDQAGLLDRLAGAGSLDIELMHPLASGLAEFHQSAERREDHGGAASMARVIDGNADGFREQGGGVLDAAACRQLTRDAHDELGRVAALLDERRAKGFVRQCHGDLHLRNIVLLDGTPTLFDAIEFNDELSCIDVLYDLSFLVMDLWRRGLRGHAQAIFDGYLARTQDLDGLRLLPLFLSCRAAVRAKTSATAAGLQADTRQKSELQNLARKYLRMASALLRPAAPRLVAVGGLSGSGKSTLARAIAPGVGAVPGAVVLRSDAIRKELRGAPALTRLGPEAYTEDVSRQVYETLVRRATTILSGGQAVIADAVFARPEDRDTIERCAASASVPFAGLWLDAPASTLIARVEGRGADASDADATVVRLQRGQDVGVITWHRLDAARGPDAVRGDAAAILRTAPDHGDTMETMATTNDGKDG